MRFTARLALRRIVRVGYYVVTALIFLVTAVTTVVLVAAAVLTPDRVMAGAYGAAAIVFSLIAVLGFIILAVPQRRHRLMPGAFITALHHHEDGTTSLMLEMEGQSSAELSWNREQTDLLVWRFRCLADDHTIVTVIFGPTR